MESFIAILGVSRYRVNNLMNDFKKSGEVLEKRGGFRKVEKYSQQKVSVMNFINQLKCVESHYCRGKSNRKYLPSELNVKKLWKVYSSETGHFAVKLPFFRKIHNTQYNVGFGTPRTDVCSTCLSLREKLKTRKRCWKENRTYHRKKSASPAVQGVLQ